jgi:class 3 adenylate cyclase/pimeloyl-ACP methyl ester carboxylesterase
LLADGTRFGSNQQVQIPPETHYARHGELSIAFQVFGEGPVLVLCLEMPSHLDLVWIDPSFTEVLTNLASFSRVVLFDRAGMGLSDPVSHVPTIEEMADQIEAVMDAAGVPRATVFGLGTATPGFALFAARAPERVERLVLWGAYGAGRRSPGAAEIYGRLGEDIEKAWFEDVIPNWGRGHSLRFWAPGLDNERTRRSFALLERASAGPLMIRAVGTASWEADVRTVLPAIQAPTLVMVNADGAQPVEISRHAAELIANCRFEVLPPSTEVAGVADYFARAFEHVRKMVTGGSVRQSSHRLLATMLFTDIVGSTVLATELGDERWRIRIARHDEILRDHVEAAGGRVVRSTGDGALSIFDGPARAVRCARALIDALGAIDISIRAGLHSGECELLENDLAGVAVHIAARVSENAGPGEVWVSRTVRDLVAGSGLAFNDRGIRELKGVNGAWELLSLAEEGNEPFRVTPEPPPTQAVDRLVLTAARRAPALLRIAGRFRHRRSA